MNVFADSPSLESINSRDFFAAASRMSSSSTQPWPEDTQSVVSILDRILQRLEYLEKIQLLLQDFIDISHCDPIDIDNGPWQANEEWIDDEREATLHGSQ